MVACTCLRNTRVATNWKLAISSFPRQAFFPEISATAVKIPQHGQPTTWLIAALVNMMHSVHSHFINTMVKVLVYCINEVYIHYA